MVNQSPAQTEPGAVGKAAGKKAARGKAAGLSGAEDPVGREEPSRALPSSRSPASVPFVSATAVLDSLTGVVLVVDGSVGVRYVNQAAEQLFCSSAALLLGQALADLLPSDSPLFSLIDQAQRGGTSVSEYGVTLESPKFGSHYVSVEVAPLQESPGDVVVVLQEQSVARRMGEQFIHRNAARSVTAMAMMLAHEVKNPLSGIRGAAQLLEPTLSDPDKEMTRLICDEADRIVALVDSIEIFAEQAPIQREAVNIHVVLEHVRRLAENGFARHVRFVESYDPSLPAVWGNRNLLVQVFLNLVKNAAEAAPEKGGEIQLTTGYQHGIRLAVPGSSTRLHLPLVITVRDNGPGIPEDVREHLFDAFVTTKPKGKGLGLALVAKIINDLGGVIEVDSVPRRTVFRIMLPKASDQRPG